MSLFLAYIYIKYIQIKILPFCLHKNFICNKPLQIIKNTTIALFLKELRKNCLQKNCLVIIICTRSHPRSFFFFIFIKSSEMSKDTQYAIITTFKQWYCLSDWFKYYVENIKLRLKILLYRLTKPSKQEKYKMLLCTLEGKDRRYETVNGKEVPIVGHRQLELSLLRGFDALSVRYGFDCLADNMIVLWANKIDLCVLNRLKKQKKIKKVVTVLIGMPSSGKSTAGVLLAKRIGYGFIDTDLIIQGEQGALLSQIIEKEGAEGFLAIEERVNAGIAAMRCVIATGGSVCYLPRAMEHLKTLGRVVYLKLSMEEVARRIPSLVKRGVVMRGNVETLEELYAERVPLYEQYADVTVCCDGQTIDETVAAIAAATGFEL